MGMNVSSIDSRYDFMINGASYIGAPAKNTVMYVTKKIGPLISNLRAVSGCLVFAEEGISIPDSVRTGNLILSLQNPKMEYVKFVRNLAKEREKEYKQIGYVRHQDGFLVSRSAKIGKNPLIEPGCIIGHNVVIGDNAVIRSGTIIRDCIIGDDFLANENSVVGADGFTIAQDNRGNNIRIPSLGRVCIGDGVEIGAHDTISRGTGGDTIIGDYVKLDAFVYIGHDTTIKRDTEITAGVVVGGFDTVEESVFIGINATLRNRIRIGAHCIIGMGAVVTKDVPSNNTIIGNPGRKMTRGGYWNSKYRGYGLRQAA